MKTKLIILLLIIAFFAVLLFPSKTESGNGDVIEYKAIAYTVTKTKIKDDDYRVVVEIFGFKIRDEIE